MASSSVASAARAPVTVEIWMALTEAAGAPPEELSHMCDSRAQLATLLSEECEAQAVRAAGGSTAGGGSAAAAAALEWSAHAATWWETAGPFGLGLALGLALGLGLGFGSGSGLALGLGLMRVYGLLIRAWGANVITG